ASISTLTEYLALCPDDQFPKWCIASANMTLGNLNLALKQSRELSVADPNKSEYHYQTGLALSQLGLSSKALQSWTHAISCPDPYPHAFVKLAEYEMTTRNY